MAQRPGLGLAYGAILLIATVVPGWAGSGRDVTRDRPVEADPSPAGQPDEVRAVRRALGARDYVIIYREENAGTVIESVIVPEPRHGEADEAPRLPSPPGVAEQPPPDPGRPATAQPAFGAPAPEGPGSGGPVLPAVDGRGAPSPPLPSEGHAAAPDTQGPVTVIPEHVRQHIMDRLGVMIDDMRRRTLGGP